MFVLYNAFFFKLIYFLLFYCATIAYMLILHNACCPTLHNYLSDKTDLCI